MLVEACPILLTSVSIRLCLWLFILLHSMLVMLVVIYLYSSFCSVLLRVFDFPLLRKWIGLIHFQFLFFSSYLHYIFYSSIPNTSSFLILSSQNKVNFVLISLFMNVCNLYKMLLFTFHYSYSYKNTYYISLK